ncbi:MAG: hypothetical protein WAU39_13805 [Polyangiales bacterium]
MRREVTIFISILAAPPITARAQGQPEVIAEPPAAQQWPAPPEPSESIAAPLEELAPADDQARLEKWLVYLSRSAKRARISSGASGLVGSSVGMALGIWAYLQDPPDNELTRGAGLVALAGSGVFMSLGIFQLAAKSEPEKMLARWRTATEGELTLRELTRFEGELRHYADMQKRAVRLGRWTNFGMALTGALILGLTPAADLSPDGATVGYVTGGVALGAGLMGFAFSFVGQSEPDYWNAYLKGKGPPSPSRWSASPQVGRTFAGIRLVGRF